MSREAINARGADCPWLSPDDVEELTGRKRWQAQCRALATMGVPFRPNAVGRPLVERTAVLTGQKRERAPVGPNWGAIRGQKKAA